MWTDKYAPKTLDTFSGNPGAIKEASKWLASLPAKRGEGLILYGPTGTGKTTFVRLLCKDKGLALIESNASELRSKAGINKTFAGASSQATLFFKGKVIFFDEADAISGSSDRGGAIAIAGIIKNSRHPVILAVNDLYNPKLRAIRNMCKKINFTKVHPATITRRLKEIAASEKITVDEKIFDAISRTANGDLKAAINDFEANVLGKTKVSYSELIKNNWRDNESSIYDTIKIIFKTLSAQNAREAMYASEVPPDEVLEWLRENVPYEYQKKEDNARAYKYLSRSNVFRGRIIRAQYWRYQAYASDLMSVGVAVSKKERYTKFFKYQYPSKIRKMGQSKIARAQMNAFLSKIAPHLHTSKKEARKYGFLFSAMQEHAPEAWSKIEEEIEA